MRNIMDRYYRLRVEGLKSNTGYYRRQELQMSHFSSQCASFKYINGLATKKDRPSMYLNIDGAVQDT